MKICDKIYKSLEMYVRKGKGYRTYVRLID